MNTPVLVLASCRNSDLWPLTALFLKTIRIGFPDSPVTVCGNALGSKWDDLVHLMRWHDVAGGMNFAEPIAYQQWLATIISSQRGPFWICDTDMVFHGKIPTSGWNAPICGAHTPKFICPYTGYKTYSRPHTSLLRIDPAAVMDGYGKFKDSIPKTPFGFDGVQFSQLIGTHLEVHDGQVYFHDCMSRIASVVGYQPFSEAILDLYAHLNCGTYSDLVDPTGGFTRRNLGRAAAPESTAGLWREQRAYFASRSW